MKQTQTGLKLNLIELTYTTINEYTHDHSENKHYLL